MPTKITASGSINGHNLESIPVVNPGEWFGKTWLIGISLGYSASYYVVEAKSAPDAVNVFADSEYSHHIDIEPDYMGDYDEETVYRAGDDGHPVDLDNLTIDGEEGYRDGKWIDNPFPCLYHGEGLPKAGLDPRKLGNWPVSGRFDTFDVIEYASHFAVRHNPSGEERPMGDGVDCLLDDDGNLISPGTAGFTDLWAETLNEDESDTLEAYFPEFKEID